MCYSLYVQKNGRCGRVVCSMCPCKSCALFLVVVIALMCSVYYFLLSYLFKAFLESLVLGASLGLRDPQDPVDFQVKRVCPFL